VGYRHGAPLALGEMMRLRRLDRCGPDLVVKHEPFRGFNESSGFKLPLRSSDAIQGKKLRDQEPVHAFTAHSLPGLSLPGPSTSITPSVPPEDFP